MSGEEASEIPRRWLLLAYRVPSQPSRARVAVWRDLKRLGAFYIQQAVCVLPERDDVQEALQAIMTKIADLDGTSWHFTVDNIDERVQEQLVSGFRENSAKEYAEIVEECETKFFKEIEFERFRENYTFEETEEIRQDLEKLRRWLGRVEARDWLGAPGRNEAHTKVAECERLLDDFEVDVYERSTKDGDQ